jgi:hypothetical protein
VVASSFGIVACHRTARAVPPCRDLTTPVVLMTGNGARGLLTVCTYSAQRDYSLLARPCIERRNSCNSASSPSISRSRPSFLAIVRCCCTSFSSIGVSSS